MSPRAVMKTQPQMIRSNSSGGVTMNNSNNSMSKLQRHRTAADGSMTTFSSFRGTSGSPKRTFHPDQRYILQINARANALTYINKNCSSLFE